MGIPVLLIGQSGSGKSCSMRNLDRKHTIVFNVAGKPLPFRGKFDMMVTISDPDAIMDSLRRNTTNCYVIDDSQYLMSFKLIDKINENGYGKYTEIAKDFKKLIDTIVNDTTPETIVYFLHHPEVTDTGFVKAKTTGKMIDNWLTLEGLFSIVLMTYVSERKHEFITQSDGTNTCKSPIDMFPDRMENDLKLVDDAIRSYYELDPVGFVNKPDSSKKPKATVTTSAQVPGGGK